MSSEIEEIGIIDLTDDQLEELASHIESKILDRIQQHSYWRFLTDFSITINLTQNSDKLLTFILDSDIAGSLESNQIVELQEELFSYGQNVLKEELKCLKNS